MTWLLDLLRDVILPIATIFGLPLFFWYKRDRKKSRAETAVAERTVGSDVAYKEVGSMGASVAFVNEAFRVERESKDRQIKALERELHEVEGRCEEKVKELKEQIALKDDIISELHDHVAELEDRLGRLEGAK